jgi:hypothetical protein
MKKLLLFSALTIASLSVKAQALPPFKPANDSWYDTATPEQLKDSIEATSKRYEQAQRKVNLLNAMSGIRADLADDSVARLRAAQMKVWSKVPPTRKHKPVGRPTKQPAPSPR